MIGSSRSYAIGTAHFQIAGGFKSLVIVCGVYLLLFFTGLALYLFADMTSGSRAGLSSIIVSVLLVFEAGLLIVVGGFRVSSAIRTDITSRMIESHRLMPIAAWQAVLGYILGSTAQVIAFALLNVVLAYIFAAITGTPLGSLTLNQALLFMFAFLVWTLTALGTLLFRYMYFVALTALVLLACFLWLPYVFLPGFALLVGPLIGQTIFSFSPSTAVSQWAYPASFGGQILLAAVFFAGSCRRYRGTFVSTFSALQAIVLLAGWCILSVIGILLWDRFRIFAGQLPREIFDNAKGLAAAQLISSVAVAMVVALVPLRTITLDEPRKRTPLWLASGYAFACAVVIAATGLVGITASDSVVEPAVVTALLAGAHIVTVFVLLQLLRKWKPWIALLIVGGILLAYWIVPLIMGMFHSMMMVRSGEEGHFSVLATLSPLGLLISTWVTDVEMPSPVAGLIFQWAVAGVLTVVFISKSAAQAGKRVLGTPSPVGAPPVVSPVVITAPPGARSS